MISNKRMHKKPKAKTFKRGRSTHKPATGLINQPVLNYKELTTLLTGEDLLANAERERNAAQEQERAQKRAEFAEEMKLKQQENEMADMKTELSKVINAWEDKVDANNTKPEVSQVETKPNASVSQTVFDYVRDNPNIKRKDIAINLAKRGYRETTVVALVSQFIRQKLFVFGVGDGLIVTRKTYTPMYHKGNKPAPQGIAAIATSAPTPRPTWTPPAAEVWTVESVVDKLNIRQARAVFNELCKLLGEK